MKTTINAFLTVAAITVLLMSPNSSHAASRPLLTSSDNQMAAFVEGEKCDERVKLRFEARSESEFDTKTGKAARLIGNVTFMLQKQCPKLQRVNVTGVYKGDILYSGVASADGDWAVAEFGSDFIGRSSGKKEDKQNFASDEGFFDASGIVALSKDSQFECVDHLPQNNSCLVMNAYSHDGGVIKMRSTHLADDRGTVATAISIHQMEDGFFCTNPNDLELKVAGEAITDLEAQDLEEMLLERFAAAGDKMCVGYQKAGETLETKSFDEDGAGLKSDMSLVAFSSEPFQLRRED